MNERTNGEWMNGHLERNSFSERDITRHGEVVQLKHIRNAGEATQKVLDLGGGWSGVGGGVRWGVEWGGGWSRVVQTTLNHHH